MKQIRTRATIVVVALMLAAGCASRLPPNLTPQAKVAWESTQVIKALDVIRDIAVAANAATPPLVTTASTRSIVKWHEAAITTAHAAPTGWNLTIGATLDVALVPLSTREKQTLAPYVALAKTVLKEVQ